MMIVRHFFRSPNRPSVRPSVLPPRARPNLFVFGLNESVLRERLGFEVEAKISTNPSAVSLTTSN